jgi:glycosyltransferase involved in cell wall biosynthesis
LKAEFHILIIGLVWPEPKSSATGSRLIRLIELFISKNWEVTFCSAAAKSEFSENLVSIGVNEIPIELNNSSFDIFIKMQNPTVVVFDRFMIEEQYGWRVAEHCPKAVRILDTEDLHFLRKARQFAVKENRTVEESDLKSEEAKREIAAILRCDLSLIISKYELNLLEDNFKIESSIMHYLPFSFAPITNENKMKWKSFKDRLDFVTIGNFLHAPNADTVKYLKSIIWPIIRKQLPAAKIHIYGAYISQQFLEMNDEKSGFIVHGRAESALEVIGNARVLLAPIRFGAGLKGKLAEAMLAGTPSVTTSIGAEAMHENLIWNGYVRDEPAAFANAAVELYLNKNEWCRAQENGGIIINQLFSSDDKENSFLEKIKNIAGNLEDHRQNNFYGSILLHHTINSTKYMSKWIEEKNKK